MTSFVSPKITVSEAAHDIGGGYTQQDTGFRLVVHSSSGHSATIAAVFDGHGGQRGAIMSEMAKSVFLREIKHQGWLDQFLETPETTGQSLFAKASEESLSMAEDILKSNSISYELKNGCLSTDYPKAIEGGTTATLVIVIDDGTLHCFNVGDSEAWLCNAQGRVQLHGHHAPDSKDEYERIMAVSTNSSLVYDYNAICGQPRRSDGDHVFPKREDFSGYYYKNVRKEYATLFCTNGFRLAMTRSIGDEPMRSGGLCSIPSYKHIRVTDTSIVQIASDGFWDNITVDDIVMPQGPLDANALNTRWFKETEHKARTNFGSSRDNMWGYTIVICRE